MPAIGLDKPLAQSTALPTPNLLAVASNPPSTAIPRVAIDTTLSPLVEFINPLAMLADCVSPVVGDIKLLLVAGAVYTDPVGARKSVPGVTICPVSTNVS